MLICGMLLLAALPLLAQESSGVTPAAGTMVFFPFDDEAAPWRDNLKVTFEKPRKHPANPVFAAGGEDGPDGFGAILYGTVLYEGGRFRMWYLAWPRHDGRIPGDAARIGDWRPIAYAESADGVRWTRPELGLTEFRGSKRNNLVAVEPADHPYARSHDFISVLLDPADPDAQRRYKMAYITRDEKRRIVTTATAVSPDGLRWKLVNTDMITGGHYEHTSLIRFQGLYYAAGQNMDPFGGHLPDGSPAGRVMTVFFSPDFLHWSTGRALSFYRADYAPKPAAYGQETHMGAALWNRGNVILGLYGRWYGDTVTGKPTRLAGLKMDLGFVISNDAIRYREPQRHLVWLERGGPADWDSEALLQANAFANTATETLVWYSHWYTSNPSPLAPLPARLDVKPNAIGLATLPRDRFAFFSKRHVETAVDRATGKTAPRGASLLTAPVRLERPSRLFVNADGVSPAAPLRIELVDDAERPLAGYRTDWTAPALKGRLSWKTLPQAATFRIRVTWPPDGDPRLYALYLE